MLGFSAICMKAPRGRQFVYRVISHEGQAAIADYTCDGQQLVLPDTK